MRIFPVLYFFRPDVICERFLTFCIGCSHVDTAVGNVHAELDRFFGQSKVRIHKEHHPDGVFLIETRCWNSHQYFRGLQNVLVRTRHRIRLWGK